MSQNTHDLLLTNSTGAPVLVNAFDIAAAWRWDDNLTMIVLKDVHPGPDLQANILRVSETVEQIASLRAMVSGTTPLRLEPPK